MIAPPSQADLESALRYGNYRSAEEHLPLIWKKIGEDVRREKCLVIEKTAAHEIPNVAVLPLGAVVTHKVRIVNDLSFDLSNRAKKGPQLEQPERERILYRLAEICTSMMRDNRGRVGDAARSLGGILVTPPVR